MGNEKYRQLIDAETWSFIERTNSWYPPETIDYTIEKQRAIYDAMCREFHSGTPDGVTLRDATVPGKGCDVPVRHYAPIAAGGAAQVVYYHGGGFVVGGLESHDDVCAELCLRTGFPVMSVDYRLSPEHVHPAAYDDALAGFEAAAATSDLPVVLCGDSAGGNLAAAVSHATRGHPRAPVGQVLIYPGLGGDLTKGSYVEHAEAPLLTTRDILFYSDIRGGGRTDGDPTLVPLADDDFSGLPPSVIITAQCDPLSDDGRDYRDRIQAAGGKVVWFNETGLVHGYLRARHTVGRARNSFTRIVEATRALGQRTWPYG